MPPEIASYPPVTEELLQEAARRLRSAGSPSRIILFGSHARGEAHPDSDVDFLVIEPYDRPRHTRSAPYLAALAGMFPAKDVVVWTPEEIAEWADVPNCFITQALREGRVLDED